MLVENADARHEDTETLKLDRLRILDELNKEGGGFFFTGRQDVLAVLAALAEGDEPGLAVMLGMPGAGKSALRWRVCRGVCSVTTRRA
jgi:hypothetical protein